MILDKGICTIYSVTNSAGAGNKPVDVLTLKYQSWYGELDFSSDPVYVTEFREDVETTARIRVHQNRFISTQDILKFGADDKHEITRVYHAVDKENGQLISDLSLRRIN